MLLFFPSLFFSYHFTDILYRISPRPSPRPNFAVPSAPYGRPQVPPAPAPAPTKSQSVKPPQPPGPQSEMDLELNTSDNEEALCKARRVRRQAIMAKYTGIASVGTQSVSPSPGPSSADQPPPPLSSISNLQSQLHSSTVALGAPGSSSDPILQTNGIARTCLFFFYSQCASL